MKCKICDNEEVDFLGKLGNEDVSVTSDSNLYNKACEIYYCDKCGLVQKEYKKLNEIYDNYNIYNISDGIEQVVFNDKTPKTRSHYCLEKILKFLKPNGKMLDIGTGNGAVLKSASELLVNYELFAQDIVDVNKNEIMKIRNVKEFFLGDIMELNIDNKFDIITLWHCLEHVENPVKFLNKLHTIINDDGYLFLQVPDLNRNYYDLAVIDHLFHFNSEILKNFLERLGFEIIIDGTDWIWNSTTLLLKKSNKICSKKPFNRSDSFKIFDYLNESIVFFENQTMNIDYYIFGCGMSSIFTYSQLSNKPRAFIDEDKHKLGKKFCDIDIIHPNQICNSEINIVMPFFKNSVLDLKNKLENMYFSDKKVNYIFY